jgi:hypothetical protein
MLHLKNQGELTGTTFKLKNVTHPNLLSPQKNEERRTFLQLVERTLALLHLTQQATIEATNRNPDRTCMNNEYAESDSSSESDSEDEEDEFELPGLIPRNTLHLTQNNERRTTFAASSATEAEGKLAKEGRHPDGSTPASAPKRAWRQKMRMECEETEALLDTSGDMDWLFETYGEAATEDKRAFPERDDLIIWDPATHAKEIDDNIQWRACPPEHQKTSRDIIERFLDGFAQEGMQNHIRGFELNIVTGQVKPACCKQPQHGPHESRVITAMVEKLEKKGTVKDDKGPGDHQQRWP